MKKGKILIVGLIALLMAGGLVLVGCANPCEIEKGKCSYSISTNKDGTFSVRNAKICGDTGCRVAKDAEKLEEKPGACDCK